VWFVPVAGALSGGGLVSALANALGWEGGPGEPHEEQLIGQLREKELLLILDGFEHPPAGGRLLRKILRWTRRLRILVTSHARLGLPEEWVVPLGGLDVPPNAETAVSAAQGYSAVQLFLQSARRADPAFDLGPENLPDVVRICSLVGGLPLGIERAAVQVPLHSCRQIGDKLERGAALDVDYRTPFLND
jgi:non-specific serine/threonine protein kinase